MLQPASRSVARRAVSWDPVAGVLTVGNRSVTLTCPPGDNDCILTTYLHLVAEQRCVTLDRSVVLRRDDVRVLAGMLDLDDVRLEARLRKILRLSGDDASALRRDLLRQRVTLAAFGVVLAAGVTASATAAAAGPGAPAAVHHEVPTVDLVAAPPAAASVLVEVPATTPPTTPPVSAPPVAAASAPTPALAPQAAAPDPEPEPAPPEVEIGYTVTYERDPGFVAPEGVDIGDAMVIERDLPPPED